MDDISKLEAGGYLILAFVVLGIIVYVGYELESGGDGTDPNKPTGGTNLINNLGIGTSSETYATAAQQVTSNPFTSASTIVGGWWNDMTGN